MFSAQAVRQSSYSNRRITVVKRIEDDLTNEPISAYQKHRLRKRRAGFCCYSGCWESPELNPVTQRAFDKCLVHRLAVQGLQAAYRAKHKTEGC